MSPVSPALAGRFFISEMPGRGLLTLLQHSPSALKDRTHEVSLTRSPYYESESKQLSPGFLGVEGQMWKDGLC